MSKPALEVLQGLGASLRQIDPTHLVQDDDGFKVAWYLGDNATELYTWSTRDGKPDHLQLVFARVSVEWSAVKGLSTGTFKGGGSTSGGRYDPYLLAVGGAVDREVCEAAVVVLRSSAVDPALCGPMLAALDKAIAELPEPPPSAPR